MLREIFEGDSWEVFNSDPDFIELRKYSDPHFEERFSKIYKQYIRGEWQQASPAIAELLEERPYDGPCQNLDKVIN